jgi:hypothetical protein
VTHGTIINFYRASRLDDLKGYVIAIEAIWYFQNLLDTPPSKEPLLSALGGLPLALKSHIEADLDQWERAGLIPYFIFDGLSIIGEEEMSIRTAKESGDRILEAWRLYCNNQATDAVSAFGNSGTNLEAPNLGHMLTPVRRYPCWNVFSLFSENSL